MSKQKEVPIELFYDEGLITLTDDGKLYTNQTGGVSCNHPEARGRFDKMPVPDEIKSICYDNCGLSDDEVERCNEVLERLKYPFKATGGEEAWLYVEGFNDFRGILVWENSD